MWSCCLWYSDIVVHKFPNVVSKCCMLALALLLLRVTDMEAESFRTLLYTKAFNMHKRCGSVPRLLICIRGVVQKVN